MLELCRKKNLSKSCPRWSSTPRAKQTALFWEQPGRNLTTTLTVIQLQVETAVHHLRSDFHRWSWATKPTGQSTHDVPLGACSGNIWKLCTSTVCASRHVELRTNQVIPPDTEGTTASRTIERRDYLLRQPHGIITSPFVRGMEVDYLSNQPENDSKLHEPHWRVSTTPLTPEMSREHVNTRNKFVLFEVGRTECSRLTMRV